MQIAFLGDTLLGGEAETMLRRHGYPYAFRDVKELLVGADLVVANHEGPLTTHAQPQEKAETGRKRYWYRGRPDAAEALADLGVRVVSLANNHVLDFGLDGLNDTIAALDAAGIAHCGAGRDEDEARRPAIVTVGGRRIGFVSCMQRYEMYVRERLYASTSRAGCYRLRVSSVREDLDRLLAVADVRIVLVHWGRNYRGVSARQERLAAAFVDAGADLVIGHHPHIAQRVEFIHGVPVLYSLGNGLLGTPGRYHSGRPPYGLLAKVEFGAATRAEEIDLQLLDIDNSRVEYSPSSACDESAREFLRSLVAPVGEWHETERGLRWSVGSSG